MTIEIPDSRASSISFSEIGAPPTKTFFAASKLLKKESLFWMARCNCVGTTEINWAPSPSLGAGDVSKLIERVN